jgi:hypothetical protein
MPIMFMDCIMFIYVIRHFRDLIKYVSDFPVFYFVCTYKIRRMTTGIIFFFFFFFVKKKDIFVDHFL